MSEIKKYLLKAVKISAEDAGQVLSLYKKNKQTLGFLALGAFEDYFKNNGAVGVKTKEGVLVGYVLFAVYPDYVRVCQVCVNPDFRGQGVAKILVEYLKSNYKAHRVLKLKCRRDYEAHSFWSRIGFVAFDESIGKSEEGHPLTHFIMILKEDDGLELWTRTVTNSHLDCVIDAQIFYDFDEPHMQKSIPSKQLSSDSYSDDIQLWITDELLAEIDRCPDKHKRESSRERAKCFNRISYSREIADNYEQELGRILPCKTPNQKSDIRQIAKSGASDATCFLTRDAEILQKRFEIQSITNCLIYSPEECILLMDEKRHENNYESSFIIGSNYRWEPFSYTHQNELDFTPFLFSGESKGRLVEEIKAYLSQPETYRTSILYSNNTAVAIRVVKTEGLSSSLIIARSIKGRSLTQNINFLLLDSLQDCINHGVEHFQLHKNVIIGDFLPTLDKLGFLFKDEQYHRFILPYKVNDLTLRQKASTYISNLDFPKDSVNIEKLFSPALYDNEIPTFMVSIREGYARQMIDSKQASQELFAEKSSVLLAIENVYYRTFSHQHMLRSPARIIWYVSGNQARLIGMSYLDEILSDTPKELFKRLNMHGVFEWRDIFELAGKNLEQKVMALKFSMTVTFPNDVLRNTLLEVCQNHNFNLALPSPTRIPMPALTEIFDHAFHRK